MKFRNTLITFILFVAVVGIYVLLTRKVPSTQQVEEHGKKVWVGPEFEKRDGDKKKGLSDIVTKLRLKKGDRVIVLKKKGEADKAKWQITEPLNLRGDKSEVNSILSEFEWMQKKHTIRAEKDKPLDLAKYGLDKPELEATITIDSREWTLQVGKRSEIGKDAYVRRTDEPDAIYVVSDSIISKLDKSLNQLRDKAPLPLEKAEVEKVELRPAEKSPLICSRTKEGWFLAEPLSDYGSKDAIEKLLDKINDLKIEVEDFIDDNPEKLEKYGLDKPVLTVAVYREGAAQTLLFGGAAEGKEDKVYAKRQEEPAVFALKKSAIDDLTKTPNDLRDKKVLRLETSDVTRIETTVGQDQAVVVKEKDEWKIEKPSAMPADNTQTSDFLKALADLEAKEWIDEVKDLAEFGLKEPKATIKLTLKEDKGTRELLVGLADKEKCYVQRAGAKHVCAVKPEFLETATSGYLAFLKKRVLEFAKADAKKITVKRDGQTYVCQKEGDKWKLFSPIVHPADTSNVDDILWDLSYLDAKKFIAKAPPSLEPYGLDKPAIETTIEYEEEVKDSKAEEKKGEKEAEKKKEKRLVSKTLLIGAKKEDDTYYAKLQDGDIVFLIAASVVNNLKDELASRTMMDFKKDEVKSITLKYYKTETLPEKEVRYEKEGDKWVQKQPEEKPAKKEEVNDILDTMSALRAKSIVTYELKEPQPFGLDAPTFTVTLDMGEKKQKVLTVGAQKKEEEASYATVSDSKFVYVVAKYDLDRLMKQKPEEPKKEEPKTEAKQEKTTQEPEKKEAVAPAEAAPKQ